MSLELVRERVFENNGTKLAAKEWGRPGFPPVIALHGWLDNANSFDRMLPFLDDIHLIAIDKAGHGLSGSRSADSGYDIWQDIGDVIAVADAMDFDRFGLLGHSRGASICGLVAGCFPQRVSALMLVEGYLPMPNKPQDAPSQIARSLHENRRFASASPTFFPSFERAVLARVNGFLPLTPDAAETLAKRGVKEGKKGFYWANDQRLKAASMVKFTSDQLKGFCDAIACPVKLIKAEDSVLSADHLEPDMLTWIPQMQVVSMPGSHHLHLEDQAEKVALEAQSFFA